MSSKKSFASKVLCVLLTVCFVATWMACGSVSDKRCTHTWFEWSVQTEATCAQEGAKVRTCKECGEVEEQVIEKTEHTGEIVTVKTSESHATAYSCCGTIVEEEVHDWNGSKCLICGFQPTVEVEGVKVFISDGEFSINVSIIDNPGLVGVTLTVYYDDQALILESVQNGEALSELSFTEPGKLASGNSFLWDGMSASAMDAKNGKLLTLNFRVSPTAEVGLYPISVVIRGYDNNLKAVEFNCVSGSVTVRK